jgi:SOS response regulatory protein OraA/RecX
MAQPASTATALMTVSIVTALRARGSGRVAVELDGRPWRVVPLEVVYAAGLAVGGGLDRASARALRRELRRVEARGEALRALRARDHTRASLERRLADRGTAPAVRRETVEAVRRAGLIDDQRFAATRAALLARRGAGDLLIADDLERHGVPGDAVHIAIGGLEPESARATAIIEARGRSPRTARYLAAKGFSEATLEALVADLAADALE